MLPLAAVPVLVLATITEIAAQGTQPAEAPGISGQPTYAVALSTAAQVAKSLCQVHETPTGWTTTGWIERSVRQSGGKYRNLVITNAHLVALHGEGRDGRNRHRYTIKYAGNSYPAYRIAYVTTRKPDLAAFCFDTSSQLPDVDLSQSDPRPNEYVQTMGFPYFSAGRYLFSQGRVLRAADVYSIDASYRSESGQSGSPVINARGEVCGINHSKDRQHGPGNGLFCGVGPIRRFIRGICQRRGFPRGYSERPFALPFQNDNPLGEYG